MSDETYVKVPQAWLERLMEIAEQCDPEDPMARVTCLPQLKGYISSADTLIKYNKVEE